MTLMDPSRTELLVIDLQARLVPAIDHGDTVIANAGRLISGAALLDVPRVTTEQNPDKLGPTIPPLAPPPGEAFAKMSFDALADRAVAARLDNDRAVVVCGCEAHICVLQTVMGLLARGRDVYVVADATGSRNPANRHAALRRMERAGAGIVTTEMVLFEWLGSADHPAFRQIQTLIK